MILSFRHHAPHHLECGISFLDKHLDDYPWASLVSDPYPLLDLDPAISEQVKEGDRASLAILKNLPKGNAQK